MGEEKKAKRMADILGGSTRIFDLKCTNSKQYSKDLTVVYFMFYSKKKLAFNIEVNSSNLWV